jgi:hypothetical protein
MIIGSLHFGQAGGCDAGIDSNCMKEQSITLASTQHNKQ